MSQKWSILIAPIFLSLAYPCPGFAETTPDLRPAPTSGTRQAGPRNDPRETSIDAETQETPGDSYDGTDSHVLFKSKVEASIWQEQGQTWLSLPPKIKNVVTRQVLNEMLVATAILGTTTYMASARSLVLRKAIGALGIVGALVALTESANAEETLEYQILPSSTDQFYSSLEWAQATMDVQTPLRQQILREFHTRLHQAAQQLR